VWKRALTDHLTRTQQLELWKSPALGLVSQPGETEAAFRLRIAQRAREERDRGKQKLRARFATRRAALEERVRRAGQQVEVQEEQARNAKIGGAISIGSAIFGALLGRKTVSAATVGRAGTAARGAGRAVKESSDVDRANESLGAARQALAELDAQIEAEVKALEAGLDPVTEPLQTLALKPKKANVTVRLLTLTWVQ
jgi:hypothetical protein